MLRILGDLDRYAVAATDGEIGVLVNFLFDDDRWTIRYLVVETGNFFKERQVLLSPISVAAADRSKRRVCVSLTRNEVKDSPHVTADEPVSRQREREFYQYYGYPYYWGYSSLWGNGLYPGGLRRSRWDNTFTEQPALRADPHLRSVAEVRDYHVHGLDGVIGTIDDFLVDDDTWAIRYIVMDTSKWWPLGKRILIAPHWASRIEWENRSIHVALSRQVIKDCPEWIPATLNRDYESRLHDYYGFAAHWVPEVE